jgi:hypothetical protein
MFDTLIKKYYDVGAAAKGAASGAAMGAALGPWGAAAGGVIGGAIGFFQKKKGNALLKSNPYPNEPIPPEVLANQQAAQNMANEGMPAQQYAQATKNIQRQQATAINSAQDRRGGLATIGAIQQGTNDATGNLDAASAGIRRENQLNLQTVNNQIAGWRDKTFDWNQKQRYLQNYQYGMSLVGSGNQNIMSGADKLLGGLASAYGNGYFSGGGGGGNTPIYSSGGGNQSGTGQGPQPS